jgi:DNA polymerase-3 subunit epsilon
LQRFFGDADRIAVVDVETTGLYNSDRVVEIAVVTLDASGAVIDEFDTLVNPGRDVGPTWIHQVTASMVVSAPTFDDVAHHVAARVDGAVCVAHNLPFDRRMLGNELEHSGIEVDWGSGLDTLSVTGCKLGVACEDYGIALDGAHRALVDARATAQLLVAVADALDDSCAPATARPLVVTPIRVLTRDGSADVVAPAPYLAALARGVHASVDVAPYVELLDSAVADLQLTSDERAELTALAHDLGLDDLRIKRAHREFIDGLIDAALDDSVLTDDEYDQLCRAAALLGVDHDCVARRVDGYRTTHDNLALNPGMQVCFTGAAVDANGRDLDRSYLEQLATQHGLVPTRSVTAKACDLLVAADPSTQSGKAAKARKFGTPITSVDAFLDSLTTGEPLRVTRLASAGVALVCMDCGTSWLAVRQSAQPRCSACKPAAPTRGRRIAAAPTTAPAIETLTCAQCGDSWERERVRGRKPSRCTSCS